jgi:hypothetical protein
MGGTIFVSADRSLDTNTIDFLYFAERIRRELSAAEASALAPAYEAMDEGGMTFLCVDDLDAAAFRIFAAAAGRAHARAVADGSFAQLAVHWDAFIGMLEADARYAKPPSAGTAGSR